MGPVQVKTSPGISELEQAVGTEGWENRWRNAQWDRRTHRGCRTVGATGNGPEEGRSWDRGLGIATLRDYWLLGQKRPLWGQDQEAPTGYSVREDETEGACGK